MRGLAFMVLSSVLFSLVGQQLQALTALSNLHVVIEDNKEKDAPSSDYLIPFELNDTHHNGSEPPFSEKETEEKEGETESFDRHSSTVFADIFEAETIWCILKKRNEAYFEYAISCPLYELFHAWKLDTATKI